MAGATVALCGKKMKRRDSFAFTVAISHVLLRTWPTVQQCKDRISYLYTNKRQSLGIKRIRSDVFTSIRRRKYSTVFCSTLFVKCSSRWGMTNLFQYERYKFMDGFNQISTILFRSILIYTRIFLKIALIQSDTKILVSWLSERLRKRYCFWEYVHKSQWNRACHKLWMQ